jgi:hypothetical protein
MPELSDRRTRELALTRALSALTWRQRREVLRVLGDTPSLEGVTPEMWDKMSAELQAVLRPALVQTALASAALTQREIARFGLGISWELVNQNAIDWAARYSFDLVRGLNETTRAGLQRSISSFYETSMTRRELEERISAYFGPERASRIAVTEITRASSEGLEQVRYDLEQNGIQMYTIWQTRNDEKVCPICGPLHNKDVTDNNLRPPAHVNCRCFDTLSLTPGEKFEVDL